MNPNSGNSSLANQNAMLNIVNNCSSLLFEFVKQFVGGRTTGSVSNFIGSTFSHSLEKISQLWKTHQKCELFPETMSFHTLRFHIFWTASIFSWFSPENCWPKSTILSTVCVNPTGQFTTNKLDISIIHLATQIPNNCSNLCQFSLSHTGRSESHPSLSLLGFPHCQRCFQEVIPKSSLGWFPPCER